MTDDEAISSAQCLHPSWELVDWIELAQRLAARLEARNLQLAYCLEWAERDRPRGERIQR